MSDRFAVRTARSKQEVEVLRDVWTSFRSDVVNADIDYHLTLVDQSPQALRPHVLLVERTGTASALVVGRIEDAPLPVRLGYKTIYEPRLHALTVSSGGVLGPEDAGTAAAIVGEIDSCLRRGEADVARIRLLKAGSPLHELARTSPGPLARQRLTSPTRRWRAQLSGSYEDYLGRRSAKTRSNIQRYGRKFERAFPDAIEFRVFRERGELDRLLEDTKVVYERTYQHGLGVGFSDSGIQREVTALALERGWFRGFVLYANEEPCAFWHGTRYGRVFSTGPTGYDPAYRHHRVGTYVLARMVEELCSEGGLEWIDFGFGDAEYKDHFGDESWLEEDVLIYARRPRPVFVNALHTLVGMSDRAVRRTVPGERLARVKRAWRERFSGGRKSRGAAGAGS